ncbi:MAG: hypothetical protein QOC94_4927 [Actinoplanes sp.]|nr:hypothetical protein [Actinoplanes sp.]
MTDFSLTWLPPNPQVGEVIMITATLMPAPAEALVSIWVDRELQDTPQPLDDKGRAAVGLFDGLAEGPHTVEATYDDPYTGDYGSTGLYPFSVTGAGPPGQPHPDATGSTFSRDSALGNPPAAVGGAAFTGVPSVDPFTGAPSADPFTGQPLSEGNAAIGGFIRDVYAQPPMDLSGVPQSVQSAILDVYSQTPIDLSAVPQSVQSAILDTYDRPGTQVELALPGKSMAEFISDSFAGSYDQVIQGLEGASTTIGQLGSAVSESIQRAEGALQQIFRPVFGALQVIQGGTQIVRGLEFAALTAESGVGFVGGLAYAANGLDNLVAGVRKIGGEDAETVTHAIVHDAVLSVTGNGNAADIAAGLVDVGVPIGGGAALTMVSRGGVSIIGSEISLISEAGPRSELSRLATEGVYLAPNRIENAVGSVGGADDLSAGLNRSAGSAALNDWSVFTPPPTIDVVYDGKLLNNPSHAVFLMNNIEMAQKDLGFLIRWGPRLDTDDGYRKAVSAWAKSVGIDMTNLNAGHPVDTIANGNYISQGQGTTYYLIDSGVNKSFGTKLKIALNAKGVQIGEPFRVRFIDFPDLPPVAPQASPPNLPIRNR